MRGRFYMPGSPEIISPNNDWLEKLLITIGNIINFLRSAK